MAEIKKVAVIGSGVMGAAIAAHCANAGLDVLLLDIVKDPADKNALARDAIEKMLKTSPAPFMHKKFAKRVTPGNLEDDLVKLADVDWVIEAVIEREDIKSDVYKKIDAHRRADTIISSNTSTIPLKNLVAGQSDAFQKHFVITHFFNPPRYMKLLEIVAGEKTDPAIVQKISDVGDRVLGKGIVLCKDTPGFIANRLGVYWMTVAINRAFAQNIGVEEADAVLGRPMGVPKTGVFGLVDLVGLDLMPHLSKSLLTHLPQNDAYRNENQDIPLITKMIADGYTGRKGKGGFYRLNTEGGKKQKEIIDLQSGDYGREQKPKLEAANIGKKGLKAVLEFDDMYGRYARDVMVHMLHYAVSLVPQIADDIVAVDNAMKWGFNWKFGPFEMIDQLGADWLIAALAEYNLDVPELLQKAAGKTFYRVDGNAFQSLGTDGAYHDVTRPDGVLLLSDVKRVGKPVFKNASASIWDIGDGVLCFEFHTKMNAIDQDIFAAYAEVMKKIGDGAGEYKALVIYNEGEHFSAGANLGLALFALNVGLFDQIDQLIDTGQKTYMKLKYAPFPVVAAPAGLALGGGCEILLHSDAVIAHAETYTGLVEVGVGLLPGWGGSKEMLLRHSRAAGKKAGPMPGTIKAFEIISTAKTSTSGHEAFDYLYLVDGKDEVILSRDRQLFRAKQRALELAQDYKAPEKDVMVQVAGPAGKAAMDMAVSDFQKNGKATPYDGVVSTHVAEVLSGGPNADLTVLVSEDELLKQERIHFLNLVKNEGTLKRIEHMLDTGKPLRN